ncbi:MAG TPA: ribonuclease M5 [Lactobacillaceae bacterium]|jgi:ribonuclease M5
MNERLKIEEIIVVEGKSDTQALAYAVDADTIETNGSALSATTIDQIQHAAKTRGVIVLTDPDFNGQRLRELITQAVPTAKHAFITRAEGRATKDNPHQSLGIEHASPADLQAALAAVMTPGTKHQTDITLADLTALGLLGGSSARAKREQIGEKLHIGYTNGKQLQKRLAAFGITKSALIAALED